MVRRGVGGLGIKDESVSQATWSSAARQIRRQSDIGKSLIPRMTVTSSVAGTTSIVRACN